MNGCVSKGKKMFSLLLAVLVCATVLFGNTTTAKAAEPEYDTLLDETGAAEAGVEQTYNFTVSKSTNTALVLIVPALVEATVTVCDSVGTALDTFTILSSQWYAYQEGLYYQGVDYSNMAAGDYTLKITFNEATQYVVNFAAEKINPTLNQKSATVTVGFKVTLKVDNTSSKVTWSSSKKDVATVNSKGVVTDKSAGTTTITAKVDGQKLTCKVKVKDNKFTETKRSVSDVYYGRGALQVYKAVYEKNGDLTIKCRFINNSGYKVSSLKDLKIVMKDANGKKIGTYSAKTKKMSVPTGSTKDFNVTIKKDKLKNKKADLRNATYSSEGDYQYTVYY